MSEIYVNNMILDLFTGEEWLVLWISANNSYGYWYNLSNNLRTPIHFISDDIKNGELEGRYKISDYAINLYISNESLLNDTERTHRDRIWEMMRGALENEPDIYDHKNRGKLLRKVAEESGVKWNNLYVYLDKYWRSGKMKNAFLPNFHNRGGKGMDRKFGERRNGRRASYANAPGKVLTEQDKERFALSVKRYYHNQNKFTLKVVYERLLQDYYSIRSEDGLDKLSLFPPNEIPSFRQFSYWYSKNRDIIAEQKKRDGERKFELSGRSVIGRSDFGLMGPGAQFQIDATVGDLYLVSQFDRSNLIGRPVLYFVIDAFSRIVTGMSVGLEGPSWNGMRMALANMAANKVGYCLKFGVKINESEWPCHHLPSALLGDRGELVSKNADNLANMLGIRVVNAPAYRADLKGIVEQHFRTINTNSVALLPGSVKPDMSKRGGHDYRLDAKLDIRQFTQIIIKCVLYYNNYHYMDYYEKNDAMMGSEVKYIPIKLWEWGIRNISGSLRSLSEEQVKLAVMPTANATVTEKGIRFKGLFYICDKAVRESWFEKARARKSWQVNILYDQCDMSYIYINNQKDNKFEICTLLGWNKKNEGKCLEEIIYEQYNEKLISKQNKITEIEAKINLNADIDSIVAEAQEMTKGLAKKSKRERVSGIKENRRKECETMRNEDTMDGAATTYQKVSFDDVSPGTAGELISPALSLIKLKLKDRLLKNE
jgi:hypothetical protein